jgi:hypothetical protein
MVKQEPVAKKMAILEQQYEALQVRSLADPPCPSEQYMDCYNSWGHSQLSGTMFQYNYMYMYVCHFL